MADTITITNMAFYAHHGVMDEEARLGQRFFADITLETDLAPAGLADDYGKAVCYEQVYHKVEEVMTGRRAFLIEALAERTAAAVLADFPAVQAVTITVRKPSAPISGHFDHVSVTITRRRG
ncbi:dihydroneopterin aldolase [Pseudoxanthobacter sp.]|uniref:dihydroneopterin aldolase n=1 Tax=Pseudoxanthobacter sp. TaxID=1925742 RepID=UPI002FE3479F